MSDDTYRLMCSQEPMREILAGLWEPKEGDWYLGSSRNLRLVKGYVPELIRIKENKELYIWLPSSGDLMEMLKEEIMTIDCFPRLKLPASYRVYLDTRGGIFFDGTILEALLLAFAYKQDLEWEDNRWKERR